MKDDTNKFQAWIPSVFKIGQKVKMPGEMPGFIRSLSVTSTGIRCEVGWWINGELREAWFSEAELEGNG